MPESVVKREITVLCTHLLPDMSLPGRTAYKSQCVIVPREIIVNLPIQVMGLMLLVIDPGTPFITTPLTLVRLGRRIGVALQVIIVNRVSNTGVEVMMLVGIEFEFQSYRT